MLRDTSRDTSVNPGLVTTLNDGALSSQVLTPVYFHALETSCNDTDRSSWIKKQLVAQHRFTDFSGMACQNSLRTLTALPVRSESQHAKPVDTTLAPSRAPTQGCVPLRMQSDM